MFTDFLEANSLCLVKKEMEAELAETQKLLALAQQPGLRVLLESHEKMLKSKVASNQKDEETSMEVDGDTKTLSPPQSPADLSNNATSSSPVPAKAPAIPAGGIYIPIEDMAWDQGEYNSPNITVYVDLPGVGAVKDRVKCDFGIYSFDLVVMDLEGKNYRLVKDNLEKDIVPEESTFKVKANKVLIKLKKKKGEFSYESWQHLQAKKKREVGDQSKSKADPMGGIMEMMSNLYEEGDDQTRKVIGEAMMKSRSGQKMDDLPPMPEV